MKTYQFAILALLAAAFVGVIYMKGNRRRKPCSCGDHADSGADGEAVVTE